MCLCGCSGCRNSHGNECFDKPDGKPRPRSGLPRGDKRGCQRGNAHRHAAPPGHCGKFRRALHCFADVSKMVCRPRINGYWLAILLPHRTRGHHSLIRLAEHATSVKYFVLQSSYYAWRRYRPRSAFQRITKTSRNICRLSRSMLTLVAGEWPQRTGISTARNPWCRARYSNSGSKPKRSMVCCSKIIPQRSRRNALKPHCVSTNGSHRIRRTILLKMIPANSRKGDSWTKIRLRSTERDPMATSQLFVFNASISLSLSSIGAERSASLKSTNWPRASCTPWRTLKPLPRFTPLETT